MVPPSQWSGSHARENGASNRIAWPSGRHHPPGALPQHSPAADPEIRLALISPGLGRRIEHSDHVHVATEGPLGLRARNFCMARGRRFTTAYHTHFPDYLQRYLGMPAAWTYAYLRWFHRRSSRIMVATSSLERELAAWGFRRMARWSRGVDMSLFRPGVASKREPVALYVGRVAYEKNIEAFLQVNLPAGFRARVVGDGPALGNSSCAIPMWNSPERCPETHWLQNTGAPAFSFSPAGPIHSDWFC